jgi:DUF4097 and DUF4098 domain-containing protein YvlB
MRRVEKVALACGSLAVCLLSSCRPAGDKTLEETIERHYPVEPTATLSVTNRDGSIRVYGAGGDTREIRVEAIKRAYQPERLKAISLKVQAQPDSVAIDTVYPPNSGLPFSDRSGTVDYVIVVPQTIRISKLELTNGEVLVEETRSSEANVWLGTGRLFAHNCFGDLDLHLKTGNLAIVYEWWEETAFSVRSTIENGNLFASLPSEAAFHLVAHTATGKIANGFAEKERRHPQLENKVDIVVGGDARTLFQFENQDGNIKISEHNP